MNDGKTTTSLGLYSALNDGEKKIGYKPVGRDSWMLMEKRSMKIVSFHETFDVSVPIRAMSPIVVDKDFTKNYLDDLASFILKL